MDRTKLEEHHTQITDLAHELVAMYARDELEVFGLRGWQGIIMLREELEAELEAGAGEENRECTTA